MNMLEVDSVILSYNSRVILSDIYLKVNTGETIGILGRNGSGKSSLLKIIFGLINAQNKSVRINGIYNPSLFKKKNTIRYLPQHPFLPTTLTLLDAINLFIESRENIQSILKIDFIRNNFKQRIESLSGGERRFFETLLILYSEAQFILLDEPFTHISPLEIEILSEAIKNQLEIKGIILTDHIYPYVLKVSHKSFFITDGKLQKFSNREDLVEMGYLLE